MNTGQVTAIIQAGFLLLAEATKDVTGSPGELRTRANECSRCAEETTSTANSIRETIARLGQTWNGQAYDRCNQSSTDLTQQLLNILRRDLEQESQRLNSAATALTQAKSAVDQQKQNFTSQANSIIQTMMQEIARARALPSPADRIMMMLAILKAVQAALSAKQSAQSASDTTKNQLSGVLSTLFSSTGAANQLVATR
ncbi:WXG100 family type VII secretion target [Plantactinospora soyae]|uniref:WXG100 family type VII secretion target n=1 Tax=Plantactinospora soyae TaxID=1544732 RepID=A0A927M010_9ACTN|nr:WXG100 family type VII secretion target [Plantactinospora soyae]MBE1485529.1 WXG100 family type VII secretion target [Plantactinospora soyae]